VILEISDSRVTLTPIGAGAALTERRDAGRDGGQSCDPASAAPMIRALVERAGCAGSRAVVLAASAECAVEFRSTPAPAAQARDAAALALRESCGFEPGADPVAVTVLGRDASGEPPVTHTLAAGERGAWARALIDEIERAGLRVDAVIPPRAVTIACAASVARQTHGAGLVATLWLGEDDAALAASEDGRLLLLRPVDAGVGRLVAAMTRPIMSERGEVRLTDADAREILTCTGVPAPGDEVDAATGLRGADVLPAIQPVLQRLVVEIKQSLRFGLSDPDRARAALRIDGSGALIPNLARVLADEAELPMDDAAPPSHGHAPRRVEQAEALASSLNLLPRSAVTTRASGSARRGLLVGLGLAALALAVDAGATALETRSLRLKIAQLAPIAAQIEASRTRYVSASARYASAQAEAARLAETAPARANWGALLADLSRLTPEAIELKRISGAYKDGEPIAAVEGAARAESDEEARRAISDFARSLGESGLVSLATLGGVRRTGDEWAFTVEVRLTPVRRSPGGVAEMEETP